MTNHANHPHPATPADRAVCRRVTRKALRDAQQAFVAGNWDDYDSLVQTFAYYAGLSHDASYIVVEEGPMA